MRNTKWYIDYNKGKLEYIDEAIEERRKEGNTAAVRELQAQAGRIEKKIKRYKELDLMSGNLLHETLAALDTILHTIEERCHVTLPEVEGVVREQLKEYNDELTRRTQETLDKASR